MNGDQVCYAAMKVALFTYGTLEIPEVMHVITSQEFPTQPAVLNDYARYKLKSGSYPAVVYEEGAEVVGTVYFEIDELALFKLDRYEDFCYQRQKVEVILQDNEIKEVMAYIVPEENKDLLSRVDWDKQQFIRDELESFLRSITITR